MQEGMDLLEQVGSLPDPSGAAGVSGNGHPFHGPGGVVEPVRQHARHRPPTRARARRPAADRPGRPGRGAAEAPRRRGAAGDDGRHDHGAHRAAALARPGARRDALGGATRDASGSCSPPGARTSPTAGSPPARPTPTACGRAAPPLRAVRAGAMAGGDVGSPGPGGPAPTPRGRHAAGRLAGRHPRRHAGGRPLRRQPDRRRLPGVPQGQCLEHRRSGFPVDRLKSDAYVGSLGGMTLWPDFGSGQYGDFGIPYGVVPRTSRWCQSVPRQPRRSRPRATPVRTRSRRPRASRPAATTTCSSCARATAGSSSSTTPTSSPTTAGASTAPRPSTCAPTPCATTATPRPTRPACRCSPGSRVSTRSSPARSGTP